MTLTKTNQREGEIGQLVRSPFHLAANSCATPHKGEEGEDTIREANDGTNPIIILIGSHEIRETTLNHLKARAEKLLINYQKKLVEAEEGEAIRSGQGKEHRVFAQTCSLAKAQWNYKYL